jgi:hypothetical protein
VKSLSAIALLTWKAAFRFRLFLVLAALLLASVVLLPIVIKDDGTARGFTQILLTYTLSVIAVLLGLSTLWLACGTLARDIEECQIQMVAVKPVARWQIWLGKWLGIMALNAALLALSGASVYGLLQWRATRLPPAEQHVLRNEVLVARGSAREADHEAEIDAETDQLLAERLKASTADHLNQDEVRRQLREQVVAAMQVVPSGYQKEWVIDLGLARLLLQDEPIYLRIKFNTAQKSDSGTYVGLWQVGDPDTARVWHSQPMSLAADTFHEFEIPPNLFDKDGRLKITFVNANPMTLLFPLSEGVEVLYREGSFGLNYIRGLGIIFCWMGLLAALGLTAASFLSFPVAAFFSLALLTMALSSGTIADAISGGTIFGYTEASGQPHASVLDIAAIPAFKGLLMVVDLVKNYSPIDLLSTGRSIPWSMLFEAFAKIVLLVGGFIGLIGIALLSRRELAIPQVTQ